MENTQDTPRKYGGRTAAEYRAWAYQNQRNISYDGGRITVNKANELYLAYFAEGNTQKAEELQRLIVESKAELRGRIV